MRKLFKLLFFAVLVTAGIVYVSEPRWDAAVAEYNEFGFSKLGF